MIKETKMIERELAIVKDLMDKRLQYIGFSSDRGKRRKIPIDFDGLLNALLAGAIPNLTARFKNVDTKEKSIEILLNYLLSAEISSSHFITLLQRKEAPNYHLKDYRFLKKDAKINLLKWILSFYYLDLKDDRKRNIVGVRTDYDVILNAIKDNFILRGGRYCFELHRGKVEINTGSGLKQYFIPHYPSSTYFSLLLLLTSLFEVLKIEEKNPNLLNLNIEILILKNSGGNKWSVVYHPMINIGYLYQLFFWNDEEYTTNLNAKFLVFLQSFNAPRLNNQNINDTYYSNLASFSYSLLVEGYLNIEKLSEIINEKISLELRAKRENKAHRFGSILFVDYVQQKLIGGESMDEKFENLRKQMQAIASKIGDLSTKGDTQRSLLKRIIMDVKSEDTQMGFTSAFLNYLPRLEREGVKVSLPPQINTLPIREFLIIKNEFVSNLWNKYIGGGGE